MRIVLGVAAIVMLGSALGGCVAVSAVGTVAGAATTVAGTAIDVGASVASGAAHTVSGGSDSDKDSDD